MKHKITINGMNVEVKKGQTILEAAKDNGFKIPTFCHHPRLENIGACRMCVVEVEGKNDLMAACSTPVKDGMVIRTNSKRVIEARKTILELLLANHDVSCTTCRANLHCRLQHYSKEMGIEDLRYEGEKKEREQDHSAFGIERDPNKCILCERCVRICSEVQTVNAIENVNRGFEMTVQSPFNHDLNESSCVECGQCVVNCPTGALRERSHLKEVSELLGNKKQNKRLIVQTAPSIRATLGECFGMKPGISVTGKMVTSLRRLGFDKVFDTDLSADLTIVEEATEFAERFKSGKNLPLITTCCPSWVKFAEEFYPDQLNHLSTCRSPQSMMGSVVKNYYAKKEGLKPEDIILVDIMPCTAKKFEIKREEFNDEVDYVLTTLEFANLINEYDIDFPNLPESKFDDPLGESSGASVIFGRTGGVMEAALRTAADRISDKNIKEVDYKSVRGKSTLKEGEVTIDGKKIKVAVAQTLGEARKLMEQVKNNTSPYHFIEVMSCYGGCVGGGGQPHISSDEDIIFKRAKTLSNKDKNKKFRKSHENPQILKLYKEEFGKFGSKKAKKYLHTNYKKRDFIG